MNEQQFEILKDEVSSHWQKVEKYKLAYIARFESNRRSSTILNWVTVVAGAITGTSGVAGFVNEESVPLITGIGGIVTAILVGLNQTFKWEQKAMEYWNAQIELDNIQYDLQRFISNIALNAEELADFTLLERLDEKLKKAFSLDVSSLENFDQAARMALENSAIYRARFTEIDADWDEEPADYPDDEVDVPPMQRIERGVSA